MKLRLGDWYCVPQFSKKQNPNFPLEATNQGVAINKDEKIGTYAKRQEGFRPKLNKLLSRWLTKSKGKTMTIAIETNLPSLLQAGFSNGFLIGLIIDRNKFRRLYDPKFGAELPQDFDFESILPSLGVVHDGKAFPVACSSDQSLESFVKSLEERSHVIFFFEELFEKEAEFFTQAGVQSGEMLRTVLKRRSLKRRDA